MPTKDKEVRAPIESGSMSDVVLHFLYIFSKSNVYENPTMDELFEHNSSKYKKKDNLSRALSRLLKLNLISSYVSSDAKERYAITDLGLDAIYKLAMYRRRAYIKTNSKAGTKSCSLRWGDD